MLKLQTDDKQIIFYKIVVCFICLFPFVVFSPNSCAAEFPDSLTVAMLQEIQEQLYDDGFSDAMVLANNLIAEYPDDPSGYLFRAITLLMTIFDTEDNSSADAFTHNIDTVIMRATEIIDTCTDCSPRRKAWMYLFRGHAHLYRSLWEARYGSKMHAITRARMAASEYQHGLEIDDRFYDLYFGLGLYHYWKSAKAGFLRWLHIVKDEKEKGIRELRWASEKSIISRQAARSALIWVWLDSKEYDSVLVVAGELSNKYPHGKSFLWPLAQVYFENEDYAQAVKIYEQLWERFFEDPGNYYNLIECDYKLYQCYKKLSNDTKALEIAQRVHRYGQKIPMETRRRQRKKLMFLIRNATR